MSEEILEEWIINNKNRNITEKSDIIPEKSNIRKNEFSIIENIAKCNNNTKQKDVSSDKKEDISKANKFFASNSKQKY